MPQFWIVAGPNGAGKTTVADRWLKHLSGNLPQWAKEAIPLRYRRTRSNDCEP